MSLARAAYSAQTRASVVGKFGAVLAAMTLCVALSTPCFSQPPGPPPLAQTAAGQLRAERAKFLEVDRIVTRMDIKPGNTILDVGAGYGMFTFSLAKALGQNGVVVATDRDADAIDYLRREANLQGLTNVLPVRTKSLVSFAAPTSIDPVYSRYTFDRILAADILPLVNMPENFFRQLRTSLRSGDGRLWVVDLRMDPDFQGAEFPNVPALIRGLPRGGAGMALLKRSGVSTVMPNEEVFRTSLLKLLNTLLDEPTLWKQAQTEKWPLNLREAAVREFLMRRIPVDGQNAPSQNPARRLLNRLLLQDLLGTNVWERAFSLESLQPAHWEPLLSWVTANHSYPALFQKAGYELVQEHKLVPYHYVFEFRRVD